MFACMGVCMYVYMCICMYVYMCICMYVCTMYVPLDLCKHACMYVHMMYVFTHEGMGENVCLHACISACIPVFTYAYAHVGTGMYIRMQLYDYVPTIQRVCVSYPPSVYTSCMHMCFTRMKHSSFFLIIMTIRTSKTKAPKNACMLVLSRMLMCAAKVSSRSGCVLFVERGPVSTQKYASNKVIKEREQETHRGANSHHQAGRIL